MRLRRLRWWDLPQVLALEEQLFAGDPPWSSEQFWSELAGVPDSRWYGVAEDRHGAVVGYAGLLAGPDRAEVQTLAVAPTRQRRGVGRLLLDALLAEAARRGAAEVLLEVRADNGPALALYGAHGFEQVAVRRGYYASGTVDGLVLRWRRTAGGTITP